MNNFLSKTLLIVTDGKHPLIDSWLSEKYLQAGVTIP